MAFKNVLDTSNILSLEATKPELMKPLVERRNTRHETIHNSPNERSEFDNEESKADQDPDKELFKIPNQTVSRTISAITNFLELDGEPRRMNYILVDFTPQQGVDDEEARLDKCVKFWKLVDNEPYLERFKALPKTFSASERSDCSLKTESENSLVTVTAYNIINKANMNGDILAQAFGNIKNINDEGTKIYSFTSLRDAGENQGSNNKVSSLSSNATDIWSSDGELAKSSPSNKKTTKKPL